MLKIQMLEQIVNNDENRKDDARKLEGDDDQYGYFDENGFTYNG